jgi:hypothetical protein
MTSSPWPARARRGCSGRPGLRISEFLPAAQGEDRRPRGRPGAADLGRSQQDSRGAAAGDHHLDRTDPPPPSPPSALRPSHTGRTRDTHPRGSSGLIPTGMSRPDRGSPLGAEREIPGSAPRTSTRSLTSRVEAPCRSASTGTRGPGPACAGSIREDRRRGAPATTARALAAERPGGRRPGLPQRHPPPPGALRSVLVVQPFGSPRHAGSTTHVSCRRCGPFDVREPPSW